MIVLALAGTLAFVLGCAGSEAARAEDEPIAGDDAEAVAWIGEGEIDAYGINAHAAAVLRRGLKLAAE